MPEPVHSQRGIPRDRVKRQTVCLKGVVTEAHSCADMQVSRLSGAPLTVLTPPVEVDTPPKATCNVGACRFVCPKEEVHV